MDEKLYAKLEEFMARVEHFMKESLADRTELRIRVEAGHTAFARATTAEAIDVRRKMDTEHAVNTEKLDNISHDLLCLTRGVKNFEERWEGTLKDTKEGREQAKELRKAVIEKSLTGAIWAILGFLAYAAWEYAKSHIK